MCDTHFVHGLYFDAKCLTAEPFLSIDRWVDHKTKMENIVMSDYTVLLRT